MTSNRWLPWLPEAELREAASAIKTFEDWKRVLWQHAERAKDDHLIPLEQLYRQVNTLVNVSFFSSRLFTAEEHASSHCHIGNQALTTRVIRDRVLQILDADRKITP